MDKQIHFCSGLPRAGSTVLMNILQQNPRVFTTSTCPLTRIINDIIIKCRYKEEFQAMTIEDADPALYGLVTYGAQGWFSGLTEKPVVISKNRGWGGLMHLFPDSKYIVTIRDLRDVVESFVRVNDKVKALHTFSESMGLLPSMTDDEKYHYFFNTPNPVSGVLQNELARLHHAHTNNPDRVIFIRYEDLMLDPIKQLNRIYDFLQEDRFRHDLNNIEQSKLYEHDMAYFRERTSHKVSPSILTKKKETRKLPESFHTKVVESNKPFYQIFYPEVLK